MMRADRLVQACLAACFATITVMLFSGAATAENTCLSYGPDRAEDARGVAWTGVVVDAHATSVIDASGEQDWVITFDVDAVYATDGVGVHPVVGKDFDLATNNCGHPGDLGLHDGRRYLVSFLVNTAADSEIAWAIGDRETAKVVDYYDSLPAFWSHAKTLDDALQLVAPGSLPPTDVAAGIQDEAWRDVFLAVSALLGAAAGVALSRRRRGGSRTHA